MSALLKHSKFVNKLYKNHCKYHFQHYCKHYCNLLKYHLILVEYHRKDFSICDLLLQCSDPTIKVLKESMKACIDAAEHDI